MILHIAARSHSVAEMNGWTFWIERGDGAIQMIDVYLPDFDKAETRAVGHAGGGKTHSYTRRPAEWMGKLYRDVGLVKTVIDANHKPRRGDVRRGSRADTKAARS